MTVAAESPLRRGWGSLERGQNGSVGRSAAASLVLEDVEQRYGEVRALDGVSFAAEPGEIICLLGHSGCGKTTLLRIAAGVERPTAGRVLLDGADVASAERFVPPEDRGVGLMFQDYALFPHLSNLDNVTFGIRNLPAKQAEAAGLKALERVGLASYARDYPHMLSGGEQQRVALARAVAPRPGILLMDEPFSNLDRRMRDAVREETVALLREIGATTIVVTHDPEEAMRISDRIVLMRRGRIIQTGSAEDLYLRPQSLFVARFFSDLNEMEGVVSGGAIATPLGRIPAPGLAEGERAVVCLRPQGVRLLPEGQGTRARILSRHFLGEVDFVTLSVEGIARPFQARIRERLAAPEKAKVGHQVGLAVDLSEILVFAASGA